MLEDFKPFALSISLNINFCAMVVVNIVLEISHANTGVKARFCENLTIFLVNRPLFLIAQ